MNQGCSCTNLPYKSVVWGIVLSLLLGPLGLLYTCWISSVIFLILFVAATLLGKFAPAVCGVLWLISLYLNVVRVEKHNCRLLKGACATECKSETSCQTK